MQVFNLLKPLSQGVSCLLPYHCASVSCLFLKDLILHYFLSVQHFEKLLLFKSAKNKVEWTSVDAVLHLST